jgi:hypothetical protein
LILTRLDFMTTYICFDTFQHVKTIIIKFIFETVEISSDAFHNKKTSLILVQIIIEENVVKNLQNIICKLSDKHWEIDKRKNWKWWNNYDH